jgi:monoamine oxidase
MGATGAMGVALSAAGIGGISSLTGCVGNRKDDRPARGLRVVVVGAGFSGLACADTLVQNGATVTVLDSTSRPGGRVLTDRSFIEGRNIELGAEFIGTNHPTWLNYAQRFEIPLLEAEEFEGDTVVQVGGKLIKGEAADKLYEEIDAFVAEEIALARDIDPIRPWTSPRAAELDMESYADFVERSNLSADAKKLLITVATADNGVEAREQSLLAYLAMVAGGGYEKYYTDSEIYRADGGNDRLARAMADHLGRRVRFGTPVKSVRRNADGVTVRTAGGETFGADAVVLTVPPSVWDQIEFTPALDSSLRPQMGRNTKLILALDEPVWEKSASPELVSDALVNLTWVPGERGESGPYPFTLFSGGSQAQRMCDLPLQERLYRAADSIEPVYPGVSNGIQKHRFVGWPIMSNVRASYSFPAPGQVTAFGPALVDGIDDGNAPLRFAGEHTSYAFIGYMEGALSSGVRVANALVESAPTLKKKARAMV